MRTSFAFAALVASACADPNFDKVRSNLVKIPAAGPQTNWGLDLKVAGTNVNRVPLAFNSTVTKIKHDAAIKTAIDAA